MPVCLPARLKTDVVQSELNVSGMARPSTDASDTPATADNTSRSKVEAHFDKGSTDRRPCWIHPCSHHLPALLRLRRVTTGPLPATGPT